MYDNLQQAIHHRRFSSIPRPYPHNKFHDMNGVEPWEKNTLELLIDDQPSRQVKTFYHAPKREERNKYYTTMRGFSFRTDKPAQTIQKTKSVAATSRKSAISQYNINGNILGELNRSPRSLPFQLPIKAVRTTRHREKLVNTRPSDFSETTLKGFQSLMEIKRKIKLQKEKSNEGFVHFNSEADEQGLRLGNVRRKSKVIALGFQKLSVMKSNRQKSNKSKLNDPIF